MAKRISDQIWRMSHVNEHPTKRDRSPTMALQQRGSLGSNKELNPSTNQFDGSLVNLAKQIRSQLEILVVKVLKHQDRPIGVDADAAVELCVEV